MKDLSLPITLLCALLSAFSSQSQNFDGARSMNLSVDFQQIKDELNYGLVFSGPQLRFTYRKAWILSGKDLIYQGDLAFGYFESRKMQGLNFNFKPFDLHYYAFERIRKISLYAGPWLKGEYNYQLYPHLQSGYSFHFTNYTFGFNLTAKYRSDSYHIRLQWKNSLFGMISRPPLYRDPYFFELDFGSYISDQHNDFDFGSFNLYNNAEIEIHLIQPVHPRIGYSYSFAFFHNANEPWLDYIRHSFCIYFYPKSIL